MSCNSDNVQNKHFRRVHNRPTCDVCPVSPASAGNGGAVLVDPDDMLSFVCEDCYKRFTLAESKPTSEYYFILAAEGRIACDPLSVLLRFSVDVPFTDSTVEFRKKYLSAKDHASVHEAFGCCGSCGLIINIRQESTTCRVCKTSYCSIKCRNKECRAHSMNRIVYQQPYDDYWPLFRHRDAIRRLKRASFRNISVPY